MKLREHMNMIIDEEEFTCFDSVIDSEFYFYKEDDDFEPDPEFPNVDNLMEYLKDHLEVKEIYDSGVEVGLYELLDHPVIIDYAKEHLYFEHAYSSDEDVVELLFDNMVGNISTGFEGFSGMMLEAFYLAYPEEKTVELNNESEIDAILVERNYKGELERFALTPDEFKKEFPEVANLSWPIEEADSHTLRPLVHIWYSPCKVGDELWNSFFTDMQWGLSEGDLKNGFEAYIREDFMGELNKYLSDILNAPDSDTLRKVYVLSCKHEHNYGVSTYTSLHASQAEAEAHVDIVKENCDFEEDVAGEYFDYEITIAELDISKLEPVKVKPNIKERKQDSLDEIIQDASQRKRNFNTDKEFKMKDTSLEK